jgi:hypothetical protein
VSRSATGDHDLLETLIVTRRVVLVVVCCVLLLVSCDRPGVAAPGAAVRQGPVATAEPAVPWQYQLQGPVDTSVDAGTFVVDAVDVGPETVADLHRRGRTVVCYVNAGAVESWRPDAARYPAEVVGTELDGWEGERWLDVRRTDVLLPILAARLDLCRSKGFDGVEADNVDGYTQDTGFPLTADDQLRFNRAVAALAHERSLTIGLKNDLDQVDELVGDFDFAIDESCVQYEECDALTPFTASGKTVLHVEYDLATVAFCPVTARLGFRSIRKPLALTAPVEPCPDTPLP